MGHAGELHAHGANRTFRVLGGFDGSFRRRAELDLAVRAAFAGAHFISVDAPLVTQYLTPTADKASNAQLRYRLLLVEKHRDYLKEKRCYAGAWCYVHAQFHRSRDGPWRLWYLAALIVFPWRVSLRRIRGSSLARSSTTVSRMDRPGLIGRTDSRAELLSEAKHARVLGTRRRASTDRVIVLNCFGRGGSGIVWRMIGSSPDVIMTRNEWHVAVFGEKGGCVGHLWRCVGQRPSDRLAPFQRYALGKTREMQRPVDVAAKPDARSLVVKLMDYHLVFAQTIGASFERATFSTSRDTRTASARV